MAVPKRKKSKMRVRQRRAQIKAAIPGTVACECGATRLAHRACPSCGKYDGRQVLGVAE
ncbi:MAG: 50S ribosomal protein L32 [bacterium]|nr:50S ribosomal protein L32 [bacterium]MDO5462701.1 50S ribosomal protein L32 [bacterium]